MKSRTPLLIAVLLIISTFTASAAETGLGKITYTQGHHVPACRTIEHLETSTATTRHFRIADTNNDSDISSIVLSALVTGKNVRISYTPGVTTGCGAEPRIEFITFFSD